MFRSSYEGKIMSIFRSSGSDPLRFFDKVSAEHEDIRRVIDDDMKGTVIELISCNPTATYVTIPYQCVSSLAIYMPVLNIIVKNLQSPFSISIQVRSIDNGRYLLQFGNVFKRTRIGYNSSCFPLNWEHGWNRICIDLDYFLQEANDAHFKECEKLTIFANCRLRRIFFTRTEMKDSELPEDFIACKPEEGASEDNAQINNELDHLENGGDGGSALDALLRKKPKESVDKSLESYVFPLTSPSDRKTFVQLENLVMDTAADKRTSQLTKPSTKKLKGILKVGGKEYHTPADSTSQRKKPSSVAADKAIEGVVGGASSSIPPKNLTRSKSIAKKSLAGQDKKSNRFRTSSQREKERTLDNLAKDSSYHNLNKEHDSVVGGASSSIPPKNLTRSKSIAKRSLAGQDKKSNRFRTSSQREKKRTLDNLAKDSSSYNLSKELESVVGGASSSIPPKNLTRSKSIAKKSLAGQNKESNRSRVQKSRTSSQREEKRTLDKLVGASSAKSSIRKSLKSQKKTRRKSVQTKIVDPKQRTIQANLKKLHKKSDEQLVQEQKSKSLIMAELSKTGLSKEPDRTEDIKKLKEKRSQRLQQLSDSLLKLTEEDLRKHEESKKIIRTELYSQTAIDPIANDRESVQLRKVNGSKVLLQRTSNDENVENNPRSKEEIRDILYAKNDDPPRSDKYSKNNFAQRYSTNESTNLNAAKYVFDKNGNYISKAERKIIQKYKFLDKKMGLSRSSIGRNSVAALPSISSRYIKDNASKLDKLNANSMDVLKQFSNMMMV